MKGTTALLCLGIGIGSVPAHAEFSADLTVATDYVWRGVSQTLGQPALQGGLNVSHESGLYAGIWASNVNFFDADAPGADPADDDKATLEVDYNLGLTGTLEEKLVWDVGVYHYTYPGAVRHLLDSSEEYYASASYGWGALKLYRDFDNKADYLQAGLAVPLPHELSLTADLGRYRLDDSPGYSDYRLGLSAATHNVIIELSYTDTTLSQVRCLDFAGTTDVCDGRLVLTLSKHFGGDD